jgi:hypothetical protein
MKSSTRLKLTERNLQEIQNLSRILQKEKRGGKKRGRERVRG